MKKKDIFKAAVLSIVSGLGGMCLWSCAADAPFSDDNDKEGQALVKLDLRMSSALTRSSDEDIYEGCKLYISNSEGLLHKWTGLGNIPSGGVYFRYGKYLAEAWAGDSVPASFTDRYFKGQTEFEVNSNQVSTRVIVECKIANAVVTVDASQLKDEVKKTLKLEVSSSTGSLTFDESTISEKGYFMRAYDETAGTFDDVLTYSLTGSDIDGTPFEKSGTITNVQAAHEYRIVLNNETPADNVGGAAIKIIVREFELEVDDTVLVHGQPEFGWLNNEISIDRQLYGKDGDFDDKTLFIASYDRFNSLILSTQDPVLKEKLGFESMDLVASSEGAKIDLKDKGIDIEYIRMQNFEQFRVLFTKDWLSALPLSEDQYVINVTATDSRGMSNTMQVRIANTENALDAPFAINTDYWKENKMSVLAHKAEISINLYDKVDNLTVLYKEQNTDSWETLEIGSVEDASKVAQLTGLKDGTTYEVKVAGGEKNSDSYQFETDPETFTTESVYIIPNASMDKWWLYNKKVWMPNGEADVEFWDTGNHGSTTIGNESDNLTTQFTEFYHENGSSTSCARLQSKFVGLFGIGKLGAGNLFAGKYAGTSGTNGKIDFGREYNASHPTKLRLWVNYRPETAVKSKGANDAYIPEGEYDKGQIYIALSDQIKSVNTGDQSTLVTEQRAPELFLAYGEHTFEGKYGEDGVLEAVDIPFNYYDKAKTISPKYLIIVCCASKYGDYFSGGEGSTMYVDDFELIYE